MSTVIDVEAQRQSDGSINHEPRTPSNTRGSPDQQSLANVASNQGSPRASIVSGQNSQYTADASSLPGQIKLDDLTTIESPPDAQNDEEKNLYDFADILQNEQREPFFLEMTRLRRMHFLYLNKRLALTRKKLFEDGRAADEDMEKLGKLLHCQANAIRDYQYILSLEHLTGEQESEREQQCNKWFPYTATSKDKEIFPFRNENYRHLPPAPSKREPFSDGIREFLFSKMPASLLWTPEEKAAKADFFKAGYNPKTPSPFHDRLARFIIAFIGALFILVPMYIMAINQTRNKNLITTTVAVILFAIVCSIILRASSDSTLGATVGYAAVLMVFVGLTSVPSNSSQGS